MNDLIKEARELSSKATPGPWYPDGWGEWDDDLGEYVDVNDTNSRFIARSRTLVPELADALEKAEAENEKLSVHGGKYMEIAQKRYEMFEAATARAEKAEAELAAYKEANPPRVHGEWVVDECDTTDDVPSSAWINFHCSVCNMDYGLDEGQYGWCRGEEIPYHFCPNCGADMRKEKP